MQEPYKLFDAEFKFMTIIWEHEPVNSTELVRMCAERLGWKKSTTYTVLRKLGERGIVRNEQAVVRSLIKREETLRHESEAVVEKAFGGSLPGFLTAFLGGKKLSRQQALELKQIIEQSTEDASRGSMDSPPVAETAVSASDRQHRPDSKAGEPS